MLEAAHIHRLKNTEVRANDAAAAASKHHIESEGGAAFIALASKSHQTILSIQLASCAESKTS